MTSAHALWPFVVPSRKICTTTVLDTAPYGSHTTASDALWAGVPIITRPGATFPSRVAGSLLHSVGLTELVVEDQE
ncbi:MAG: hypothetical protein ACR650_12690 [Methylocystis sp.]